MAAGLDHIDRRILELLRLDGRQSHTAIAKEVGLSGPAVHDRVRKLEQRGIIAGYTAVLDADKLDRSHMAFCMITVSEGTEFAADDPIVARICEERDVLEFHRIAGEDCYMVKVRCRTNRDLERLLRRIRSIRGVARTRTTIVLSTELEQPTISVPPEEMTVEPELA
ncbi:MAG TPA: Lrp/AsnC family transcriptional regulator [Actinomycetota bacterium]|nr:Lrp/AsnC family transcriptional regulator [Actinomycetota bacterium]